MLLLRIQVMQSKVWGSSRGKKRSNVGSRHQILQRITIRPYSNATTVQVIGSCKMMPSQNGRYGGTPSYGYMAFLDVAKRFLAPQSLKILGESLLVSLSSISTSTSTIKLSRHLRAWFGRSLVSFTIGATILGNN